MPSNSNTDKQNDNLEQASKADEKFIDFKKRMLWLGIFFLIVAIVLSLPNYFFLETSNNNLGVGIFLFVVLADIFILLPAIITKETNWLALLGSTILCVVFFCLSVFYPFQDVQYRLKVISLVATIATLLFVALNSWINAAFFPSKNANIRQSVDLASNRFAVDVLNVTLILGTLFGTIAFLYFYPDKDNSIFFGGIDIKNVALATAGLVTFFWAAKATKNKSIDLEQKKREFAQRKQEFEQKKLEFEEKKQDGKRHDNEIAMAKRRDTAQLIAEASKLLSSENDAQKYAGLSFLNRVASDSEGTFRKEAFDILTDFITGASDVTTANKVRMRAIHYADNLVGNNPDKFQINEFIQISSRNDGRDYLKNIEIKNLFIVFIGFIIVSLSFQKQSELKRINRFAFINCIFDGKFFKEKDMVVNYVSLWGCSLKSCQVKRVNISFSLILMNRKTKKFRNMNYVSAKYFSGKNDDHNTFLQCDFSDCLSWKDISNWSTILSKQEFINCFYYAGHKPAYFDEKRYGDLLTEITSEQQFYQKFKNFPNMHYSPPEDKK